jgi:hypothetical protein
MGDTYRSSIGSIRRLWPEKPIRSGDLYSFPFHNTNFNYGPHQGTQDIVNVQPVISNHVADDWNVITRTILPLIWQPSLRPGDTAPFGTGPTTFSASCPRANGLMVGASGSRIDLATPHPGHLHLLMIARSNCLA